MKTKSRKQPTASTQVSAEHIAQLRWLTTAQTTAYLQVSRSTLLELQRSGSLPHSRVSERVIRFDRLALDKWLAENSVVAQ